MGNTHDFTMLCTIVICAHFLFAPNHCLKNNDYASSCAPTIVCNEDAKYRSFNGSCNNLIKPWLGASKTPHKRLLDASYSDGSYEFRKQTNGAPLPNAREINLKVFFYKQSFKWNDHNVLFMEWGQFIAHDVTHLPADTSIGSDCCELQKQQRRVVAQCQAVINVPEDDPIYSDLGQTCINFIRAETSYTYGCPLEPTTFMVMSNHFIDGSHIYGTDEKLAANLRSFRNGRLRSEFYSHSEEFCPQQYRTTWECESSPKSRLCFAAGDKRANQNLGIAVLQNMFLRFHNVIAHELNHLNPFWNDETLYQETRRIVIAVIQIITYKQYLPILLGKKFLTKNGLFNKTVYDKTEDPSTSIEFSAAAFRVLHKQIPSVLRFLGRNGLELQRTLFSDWMNKPDLLSLPNSFDKLLRGFLDTQTRADQPSYNPLITNYMFMDDGPKSKGQDLLAMDVQRGRDTGIQPYNKIRSLCGIPEAKTFDDLTDSIARALQVIAVYLSTVQLYTFLLAYIVVLELKTLFFNPADKTHFIEQDVEDLKKVYSSVDDVDFIVGALLETPIKGIKVGPTARCIILDSFRRYKVADRFFYDVRGQPGSFTEEQLETLKTITFNHVICATSNIKYLREDAFKPSNSKFNTKKHSCEDYKINLDEWEDVYHNYYEN